ncbi:GNAT family N-acetyltransferase [Paenibacillus sp. HN-1]|uniref:GNAT family N-acetyltransferase n=1 Tax=Paenibacillus TaxID=44249 RepID=UPI001CA93EB0|nr:MULTISPECIES: GNAT family N-acetyltransferase [Paenibacillus]MBY9080891.1 GNAT family N-acetyltransferase [Paenibacillus sp. CGMCC 1.18879]MBY9085117.1 GNAT family N-acetyltransferase [Paenibacillus sinensis]
MGLYTAVKAELKDLEWIVPLFDSYRTYYGKTSEPEKERGFLEERLRLKESVIFLAMREDAEDNGENRREAVGFAQLYPSFSSLTMERLWILNDLFIMEEARGTGAGTLLLEEVRRYALETGSKGLTLETHPDNIAAQRLYVKNGYVKDDEFDCYQLFF